MTNKEAIEALRLIQSGIEWECPMEWAASIDMAISALQEQELQPTCNNLATDTIYRRAAIDALGEEPEVWTGKDEYAQGLNNQWHYDVNALKALPSAQPEIVRCSDCKECWYSGTATIGEKVCEIYKCKFWDRIVSQNGYCYMAERRADGLGDS